MPHLNIYVDESMLRKIERSAKKSHSSISKWVREKIQGQLESSWPEGYFDLFGSLSGVKMERPSPLSHKMDVPREKL